MLIRQTQRADYPEEYNILQSKGQLPSSSCILNLNPFLDADGIMRSCGRLTASDSLSYDERHPILLAYHSKLAELLVTFTHRISIHGGNQLMVHLIRTRYWIPKLRNLIKRVTTTCKVCVIHRKKVQSQLMGKLPQSRATYSRPFTHTGLDFAGPFDVKSYSGRACRITKGYVCVFVCFSTKAIHLEATSDLTTEKFLGAFSRFAARRGCSLHLYSDNGKTFVGAEKALTEDFIAAVKEKATSSFSHQSLSWHFNPPGAPHMGGLWEAGVKSFKTHFYKTTGNFKYTLEELSTLLCRIEACLNSRPISAMSEDPSDILALTPGHFLIGGPLLVPADPPTAGETSSILNRWQRLKALGQLFASRWKAEYLKEFHKRTKWQIPTYVRRRHGNYQGRPRSIVWMETNMSNVYAFNVHNFVLFLSASIISLRQPCRPIATNVASSSTDVLEELDRSDAESVRGFIRFGRVRGFSG
ncbi:uncharacterized protein LOC122624982 [Drosophila teissieri]|uniref:uncharacterized protein LOC122624982 n=1 Tax=Drosophila teissieri TaxID=7243 RepID=UPI001CBA20DC|nr:uncharacterized protein LOC122624982 [Drosophila teissieri]